MTDISDLVKLLEFVSKNIDGQEDVNGPYIIGKNYFIRTVTMAMTGKLEKIYKNELVLSSAAWIADTGRFHDFLKNGVNQSTEVEPFVNNQIINRNSIVDATVYDHNLQCVQV